LITVSEAYRLWAIEGNAEIASILTFAKADKGVVITNDINVFKELKLRLLNATHSLSAGVAFLSGIETTKDAMNDASMSTFITELVKNEIAPAIPYNVSVVQAEEFGNNVLERFRNKFIQHQWINITLNYTLKLKARAIPVLLKHYQKFQTFPENFSTSFAAYMVFMKPVKREGNSYYGIHNGKEYSIADDKAAMFYDLWNNYDEATIVNLVLQDVDMWGEDLTKLSGFEEDVKDKLKMILQVGMMQTLQTKKVLQ
jgi:tagaturonate reductase